MKVLHLLSNWRWTGPAEPAVLLASALHQAKWDVTFACGEAPGERKNGVLDRAQKRALPTREGFHLGKHRHMVRDLRDGRRLRQWLLESPVDIVHAHMRNADVVAAIATRRMAEPPVLVRTCYAEDELAGFWNRRLARRHTDGLIVVSEAARRMAIEQVGFPADRVWVVDTAVDLERFDPGRALGDLRAKKKFASDAFVVGIVARIQRHRRYHVFLEAIQRAHRELPSLRGLIVGHGTEEERIVIKPIRRMGLREIIPDPCYYRDEDPFVRAIATMDVKVFLVPGTDGSCRAVREAMAMGVPVIAARRGMLPELVRHDKTGLVIDDTPENLAKAIVELAQDPERRAALARAARQYALDHFGPDRQAAIVGDIYRDLARRGKP